VLHGVLKCENTVPDVISLPTTKYHI
jgi:hypothetical protein